MFNRKSAPKRNFPQRLIQIWRRGGWIALLGTVTLPAAPIAVPNASFESPATFFVNLNIDSWQRTPQPDTWDTNASGDWNTLTGIFRNTTPGSPDHITNCDGNQAIWLFVRPAAGFFQDYDSMDWNDPAPTHAFDAKYEVGKSYELTVGLLVGGIASGGGVLPGATLDLTLYYRDAASNRVTVATTTVTNSPAVFNNSTNLIDFTVTTPPVQPTDAWAGQAIGILFLSTVSPELEGGYWDLDNVRLNSRLTPTLSNPVHTNGQFQFTLQSEPSLAFDILASTNATLPIANWVNLGSITNVTGTIPFIDTSSNFDQRFYQAWQLP